MAPNSSSCSDVTATHALGFLVILRDIFRTSCSGLRRRSTRKRIVGGLQLVGFSWSPSADHQGRFAAKSGLLINPANDPVWRESGIFLPISWGTDT